MNKTALNVLGRTFYSLGCEIYYRKLQLTARNYKSQVNHIVRDKQNYF